MMQIRVEGGAKLAAELQKLSTSVSKKIMREALREVAGEQIRRRASEIAPRDPGAPDIADNIVISNSRSEGASVAVVVGPSSARRSDQPSMTYARQGKYLEFGTGDTPMQAFMRPAFDEEAPRALGALTGYIWRALVSRGVFTTRGSGSGVGL